MGYKGVFWRTLPPHFLGEHFSKAAHLLIPSLSRPINSKGQKALWIGNVSPNCSIALVSHVFMKFGTVTFCKIFPSEAKNEVACLLIHFDNDISPRLVMTYFKVSRW